jgi:hypothetical protein
MKRIISLVLMSLFIVDSLGIKLSRVVLRSANGTPLTQGQINRVLKQLAAQGRITLRPATTTTSAPRQPAPPTPRLSSSLPNISTDPHPKDPLITFGNTPIVPVQKDPFTLGIIDNGILPVNQKNPGMMGITDNGMLPMHPKDPLGIIDSGILPSQKDPGMMGIIDSGILPSQKDLDALIGF